MPAVADLARGAIHAVIDIEAPPSRVFEALTSPEQLASWWGSAEMYRTHDWKVDLRPGGAWSCLATNAGNQMVTTVGGVYRVVDPPRVLEHTWKPSWDDGHETVVRYELEPTAKGTRVRVLHSGFGERAASCQNHEAGWNNVIAWLTGYLAARG